MTAGAERFPIALPVEPMLAALAESLPAGGDFLFGPKWDGFRPSCRGGRDQRYIQSDAKPLDRYSPSSTTRCSPGCPRPAWWTGRP